MPVQTRGRARAQTEAPVPAVQEPQARRMVHLKMRPARLATPAQTLVPISSVSISPIAAEQPPSASNVTLTLGLSPTPVIDLDNVDFSNPAANRIRNHDIEKRSDAIYRNTCDLNQQLTLHEDLVAELYKKRVLATDRIEATTNTVSNNGLTEALERSLVDDQLEVNSLQAELETLKTEILDLSEQVQTEATIHDRLDHELLRRRLDALVDGIFYGPDN